MGGMKGVLHNRALGVNAKRRLYEGEVVPAAMYGAETWSVREAERNRLDVFEMRCLKSMVGITRMDRVRNEKMRRREEIMRKMSERVDQSVLSWYGHVVRMGEERQTNQVWMAEVSGRNLRVRLRRGWMEGVERVLGLRGMSVQQGRQSASDRREWRGVV